MNHSLFLSFLLFLGLGCSVYSDSFILDDFETNGVDHWTGLKLASDITHSGSYSGCWENTSRPNEIVFDVAAVKKDWSAFSLFSMWVYSTKADNSGLEIVINSENSSSAGEDFYCSELIVDWVGWKEVRRIIPTDFVEGRYPVGWNKLTKFTICTQGWNHHPTGTKLYFDDVKLTYIPPIFPETANMSGALVPGFESRFYVPIKGLAKSKETRIKATISKGSEYIKSATWEDTSNSITQSRVLDTKINQYMFLYVILKANSQASEVQGKDIQIDFVLTIKETEETNSWSFVGKVNPEPASCFKEHPYLLVTHSLISERQKERNKKPWVNNQLKSIEGYRSKVTQDMRFPLGLSRWSGYYFCDDGAALVYDESSPKSHYCPTDKKYYVGEPYDGAWITNKHTRNINNAYYLALNYMLEKNATVLNAIKGFLFDYSYHYLSYPYHHLDAEETLFKTQGARIMPQTLDEASIAAYIAITYDIVYEDLSREEKSFIEYNFLRPLYVTIERYDAKKSNWQSWHDTGMMGLGVVLNDDKMINHALESFYFQLEESIGDDGIWYEQSIGYHFFALKALQLFAEFAQPKGYDFYHYTVPMKTVSGGKKGLKDLYDAPLHLMMPNYYVPGINDGHDEEMLANVDYYEIAYSQYPEKKDLFGWALCTFLGNKTRNSLYGLKYGQELPDWCTPRGPSKDMKNPLKSEYMKAGGAAVLRKDDDFLFFENGPHGGGHGHYDKLALVFYTHGFQLVKDYGALPYLNPMHLGYFMRTLSHSSPMLDGVCQTASEGTGPAVLDGSMEDVQIAKLTTDALNDGNRLRRTLIYIGSDDGNEEYPLIFDMSQALIENKSDVSNHFFDLITHSESTRYSLVDTKGDDVSVSSVSSSSMGDDESWQYLKSLKKTEYKEGMKGVWDLGHTVRYQFDKYDEWSHMELSDKHHRCGKYSMRWKDHVAEQVVSPKRFMADWSDVHHITLDLYNVVPNSEILYLIVSSENASNPDSDYYSITMPLNFEGWKTFNWTKDDFSVVRKPAGWNAITRIDFCSSWGHSEQASSDLYFDCMQFWREDGTEIDGFSGLEQYIPGVSHDRKTFYDVNAPSIPTSQTHAVNIIRKSAEYPIVQVLKPLSEKENFVTSFTQSDKSYVITTASETITVNPGDLDSDAPCATVKRTSKSKGTVTTRLACKRMSLSESNAKDGNVTIAFFPMPDSVLSFRTAHSAPAYDTKTKTFLFNNIKVTSNEGFRINVTSCSELQYFTISIDGSNVSPTGKADLSKKGCMTLTFEAEIVKKSISVALEEEIPPSILPLSGASRCQCSVILLFVFVIFYLFI